MKKILSILTGLCLLCALAAGCSGTAKSDMVDLTALSDTIRSAELANITASPNNYLGKTIKIDGTYQVQYFEPTNQYYHGVLVVDAAACCQQGMEFKWNGEHKYPDDYPQVGTQIELTGVFESYTELGNMYYHLIVDEITVLDKR